MLERAVLLFFWDERDFGQDDAIDMKKMEEFGLRIEEFSVPFVDLRLKQIVNDVR